MPLIVSDQYKPIMFLYMLEGFEFFVTPLFNKPLLPAFSGRYLYSSIFIENHFMVASIKILPQFWLIFAYHSRTVNTLFIDHLGGHSHHQLLCFQQNHHFLLRNQNVFATLISLSVDPSFFMEMNFQLVWGIPSADKMNKTRWQNARALFEELS